MAKKAKKEEKEPTLWDLTMQIGKYEQCLRAQLDDLSLSLVDLEEIERKVAEARKGLDAEKAGKHRRIAARILRDAEKKRKAIVRSIRKVFAEAKEHQAEVAAGISTLDRRLVQAGLVSGQGS